MSTMWQRCFKMSQNGLLEIYNIDTGCFV